MSTRLTEVFYEGIDPNLTLELPHALVLRGSGDGEVDITINGEVYKLQTGAINVLDTGDEALVVISKPIHEGLCWTNAALKEIYIFVPASSLASSVYVQSDTAGYERAIVLALPSGPGFVGGLYEATFAVSPDARVNLATVRDDSGNVVPMACNVPKGL